MDATTLLQDLIRLPSVNPMGRDLPAEICFESRVSDYLVEFLASLGVPHERIEVAPGRANVIARVDSPGATRTLLLDAHQDTVPVDAQRLFLDTPQTGTQRDVFAGGAEPVQPFGKQCQKPPLPASGNNAVEA